VSSLDERINALVTKYMGVLEIRGARPVVKLRSTLGSKWLGRSTWSTKSPHTTLLELQQSILGDDRTLERVIAHEMIHHRDAIAISEADIALIRLGIRPESHGATFHEGASRVNAIMGPDFVTEVSDKEYAHAPSLKKFFLLITPLKGGKKLGWAWAGRLSDQSKPWVDAQVAKGSRLVQTTDDRWTRGAKIKRFGGYSIPKSSEDAALLQELYAAA
jgi:hypothetical protein